MSLKQNYTVRSITMSDVGDFFTKKHYMKRNPIVKFLFGIYDFDNLLCGVSSFGTAPSSFWNNGGHLFNNKHKIIVTELNRVVINENMPKNTVSFFISKCIKLLPKDIVIISYADINQNHTGYIYQALNFLYCGESKPMCKSKDYEINGKKYHGRTMDSELIRKICGNKYNDILNFEDNFLSIGGIVNNHKPKHRYILIKANKSIRNKLKKDLIFEVLKYPKKTNTRYDCSYKPEIQTILNF